MSITITVPARSFTTASLAFAGVTGVSTQFQIGTRPDFAWCVCPIVPLSNAGTHDIAGLNQATAYYMRARNVDGAGNVDPWGPTQVMVTPTMGPRPERADAIAITPAMIVKPDPILNILAGNQYGGFTAQNLLLDDLSAWESIQPGFLHSLTFARAETGADVVALLQTNIPEDATIRIRAANAPGDLDTPIFDISFGPTFPSNARASDGLPSRPGFHCLFDLGESVALPWWRIDIACYTPGALLHVEHLVVGKNLKSKNHALDKKETPVMLGNVERTRSGVPDRQAGLLMRRIEFDLANLTEAEFEMTYSEIWRYTGTPLLIVPNTKAGGYLHDRIAFGDFIAGSVSQPGSVRYTRSIAIESII